ncbi:hypothetical protein FIBSPDRAFT_961987 [Athelia psychrophila]|uniref:Uncharacterized protein n=1 Tax=Athelia psychrophila TaxID=1759441 RepID=A0A166APC2_9AGAM|nr:hypothetical protein FIBSPDRAFT_961987 [Fibularhizoctonia sp. CBS 109695]
MGTLSTSLKNTLVMEDLTERLTTLSNQLEAALELSMHNIPPPKALFLFSSPRSTPSRPFFNSPNKPLQSLRPRHHPPTPAQPKTESLTNILAEWKKTVKSQWSSVREEWATERERLPSAREEWESKVQAIESNLGNTTAKLDAGLATLALLQCQQGATSGFGLIGGGGPEGFRGGLATPPSPRSLGCYRTRYL